MRVLADSSAWIDFLNGSASPEGAEVERLLGSDQDVCTCGLIAMEVLQGIRRERGFPRVVAMFESLTLVEPGSLEVYLRGAEVYRALRSRGVTVRSAVDCVIAAVAEAHGCSILTRDRDLAAIVESGLLRAALWIPAAPG